MPYDRKLKSDPAFIESSNKDTALILFDGMCGFCTKSVQWLIRQDQGEVFQFAAIQSEIGRKYYRQLGLDPENITSFVLIKSPQPYLKSDAVLEIAKMLGGLWRGLLIFCLIPRAIRDFAYDLLAKYRMHFISQNQSCMKPSEAIRKRFLE